MSWATTRWTAARSCSGPVGQRAVELGQRPRRRERLGALDLRALELAPQVRLEAADLVARQTQLLARDVLLHRAAGLGAQAERAADALHVDAEHAGALAAAPERGDREPREVAHGGVVAVADRLQELLAQVVELDPLAAGDAVLLIALADLVAQRLRLGGAEEEALEHEVEDAPVLGRLGERGREGGAEVARAGPRHRLQRGERVVELGRPDRHPLGAQRLSELEDAGVEAHAVAPSRTPTRSATVSRSVRCLTMIDIVVAEHVLVDVVGAEQQQRARPVDRLGDRRRLLEIELADLVDDLDELARDRLRQLGRMQADDLELVLGARVVEPQVQAAALERLGQLARVVGGEQHDRVRAGLDPPELRDRDLEVRQQLEQHRLELLVGLVDLVDQQHDRDRRWRSPASAGG